MYKGNLNLFFLHFFGDNTLASRIKWWINGIAAFIFVMLCIIYLLIRPIITQNLEPVIKDAAGERINGTLTWTMMEDRKSVV